ncbi:hypothetical protein Tco_0058684 [Tanacetum coccineum]
MPRGISLQFKLQNVWVLVDLPKGHRAIGKTPKKFNYTDGKSASTTTDLEDPLVLKTQMLMMRLDGTSRRSEIHDGSLVMYLPASRTQISCLQGVKPISSLWSFCKGFSTLELVGLYTRKMWDYAGATLDYVGVHHWMVVNYGK